MIVLEILILVLICGYCAYIIFGKRKGGCCGQCDRCSGCNARKNREEAQNEAEN